MLAGIPLAPEFDFADVGPVLQDVVDGASREFRHRGAELPTFRRQFCDQRVERVVIPREEMENATDVIGRDGINLDHAATILADVAIAVRTAIDEPAFLHTTGQPLADIDRLLFGVEAGHVRQRPPHHAAGRRVLGRLRNGNERQVVLRL